MHVRTCFSWSRRCMCSTVFQGGAAGRYTLGTPREIFEFQFCESVSVNEIRWIRYSNFSSVNAIRWMRFGEWASASILYWCWWVVVVCCVRTYGTRCLVFGDTLFQTMYSKSVYVCVCVCMCMDSQERVCVCVCVYTRATLTSPRTTKSTST